MRLILALHCCPTQLLNVSRNSLHGSIHMTADPLSYRSQCSVKQVECTLSNKKELIAVATPFGRDKKSAASRRHN